MKTFHHKIVVFVLLVCLAVPQIGLTQEDNSYELSYKVSRVYPAFTVTKAQLNEAKQLIDLNRHYQSSWVKEYKSVEILTITNGMTKKSIGKNDMLTAEQKGNIEGADLGSEIAVRALYKPDNKLVDSDVKELSFKFSVDPEKEAIFAGGEKQLEQYLKNSEIDKITNTNIKEHNLAAVKFTIDEEGAIINAHLFESTKDESLDKLLVEVISKMPQWQPAEYASGTRVKQDFVLTVGDHKSCVLNLLNTGQD